MTYLGKNYIFCQFSHKFKRLCQNCLIKVLQILPLREAFWFQCVKYEYQIRAISVHMLAVTPAKAGKVKIHSALKYSIYFLKFRYVYTRRRWPLFSPMILITDWFSTYSSLIESCFCLTCIYQMAEDIPDDLDSQPRQKR